MDATVSLTHSELEITDEGAVEQALANHSPEVVINTAAFHHVDTCETEVAQSFQVNAAGPLLLARACAKIDALLVHISTDYVFGGQATRAPLSEHELPAPLSVYGTSKLAGEHLIRSTETRHLIVRTCGLYGSRGSAAKGGNFVRTMLRLAREQGEVRVVNDQHCTPSYALDVAEAIAGLIAATAEGTYHVVNTGACTWFEFAEEIFASASPTPSSTPVSSAEFPTVATRPPYSVLATERMCGTLGHPTRPWQEGLHAYLEEIGELASSDHAAAINTVK
jgi:dTDP-4-dehydrorhamnose reductase